MVRVEDSDTASGKQRVWTLSRNCALTPRQVGALYLSLVVASVVIATIFLIRGAWMVLPFSLMEIAAVGAALLVYARHAVDRERISLAADALLIESIESDRAASSGSTRATYASWWNRNRGAHGRWY